MPELLLHFSIPFTLSAPIMGIKRAIIVGLISILPDLDALMHVHRSATHSLVLLTVIVVASILIAYRLSRSVRLVTASSLGLLSHPVLDMFQSPTPILYPLSQYSYHVSPELMVTISEEINPHMGLSIESEPVGFTQFHSFDAPIFTDTGFAVSIILITVPLLYSIWRSYGPVVPASPSTNDAAKVSDNVESQRDPEDEFVDSISSDVRDQVTVIIPTLNEEEAIGKVIEEVKGAGYKNILVVDGYSTDKTVEIARSLGTRVIYQVGHGKAMAVKTGIDAAETSYVLIMDGDGTYGPKDIDRMLRVAVENGYDEVVGYRADRRNIPALHRLGNRVMSTVMSLLMGQRIKDPCSGMYLLRTDFARNLEIMATGFDVESEIVCQTLAHGRVAEVPISYRKRIGEPKLKTWSAGFRILLTVVKIAWLYNPVLLFSSLGSMLGLLGLGTTTWQLYLRYVYGEAAWSIGWSWLGLVLLVLGINSFTIAIISLMLKRMERRIIQLYVRNGRSN